MNKRSVISLIAALLVIVAGVVAVNFLSGRKSESELEMVTRAVRNAAVTCYAVEGAYPEDVSYLEDYYGLQVDRDRYIIRYESFASNIMPEIRVLERGSEE